MNCVDWKSAKKQLFKAIEEENFEAVKKVLDDGFNPNVSDDYKSTPLMEASDKGNLEITKLLLENGAIQGINARRENGDTPLICAAWGGNIDVVKLLLKNGADILTKTRFYEVAGENAIFWARTRGNTEVKEFLTQALKEAQREERKRAFAAQNSSRKGRTNPVACKTSRGGKN